MSSLLAPSLATPLLKVSMLVASSVCTYYGMSPPTPLNQQSTMHNDVLMSKLQVQFTATKLCKYTMCALALAEATVIIAHQTIPSETAQYAPWAPRLTITPAMSIASRILAIGGGLVRIWCHRKLGSLFTWEVIVREDHKLVTSGPYAIVRHPGYAAMIIMAIGNSLAFLHSGSLFVEAGWWDMTAGKVMVCGMIAWLWWVNWALLRRMGTEDMAIKKEFGQQWETWAKKTPYRLIPFAY